MLCFHEPLKFDVAEITLLLAASLVRHTEAHEYAVVHADDICYYNDREQKVNIRSRAPVQKAGCRKGPLRSPASIKRSRSYSVGVEANF